MKKNINKRTCFEIMAIILIAIFCISLTPKTLQNDTFYTIEIGKHITESGQIDMKDPFSWHKDLPYTYPHWLYDVMIYSIYNIGGMTGIYISTCIFAAILGLAIYKINSRLVKNRVISFFITLGAMYCLRDYITARAQLVTFILFIVQIFLMEMLIRKPKKRYGIGLIINSIIIVNLHVAVWPFTFILYLPYIAEYIVAILEEKTAKKYGKEVQQGTKLVIEKNSNTKYLIIVMLICILTGFLTPLGITPYTYLIDTMRGNTTKSISEHLPMTLINCVEILAIIIIFLAMLIFTDSKIKLSDLLMICGLALLMLYSKRQSTLFIIIGSVILNRLTFNWMNKQEEDIDNKIIEASIKPFGIFVISGIIICLSLYFIAPRIRGQYIDEEKYPVEMSEFILNYFEENNLDLSEVRLYNEYNYGSYLLYKDIPVFIDSRCDLYAPEYNGGRDIFTDFIKSSNLTVYFEEIFDKYDITHVILYKNSKINMIIEDANLEDYKLLKKDDNFVFYEIVK